MYNWRKRIKPYASAADFEKQKVSSAELDNFNMAIGVARSFLDRQKGGLQAGNTDYSRGRRITDGSIIGGQVPSPPAWKVGDEVEAFYGGRMRSGTPWFPCTIAEAKPDGTYLVDWDDGDTAHKHKQANHIRPRGRDGAMAEHPLAAASEYFDEAIPKQAATIPAAMESVAPGPRGNNSPEGRISTAENMQRVLAGKEGAVDGSHERSKEVGEQHAGEVQVVLVEDQDDENARTGSDSKAPTGSCDSVVRPRIKVNSPLLPSGLFPDSDHRSFLDKAISLHAHIRKQGTEREELEVEDVQITGARSREQAITEALHSSNRPWCKQAECQDTYDLDETAKFEAQYESGLLKCPADSRGGAMAEKDKEPVDDSDDDDDKYWLDATADGDLTVPSRVQRHPPSGRNKTNAGEGNRGRRRKQVDQLDKAHMLVRQHVSMTEAATSVKVYKSYMWTAIQNGTLLKDHYWRYSAGNSSKKPEDHVPMRSAADAYRGANDPGANKRTQGDAALASDSPPHVLPPPPGIGDARARNASIAMEASVREPSSKKLKSDVARNAVAVDRDASAMSKGKETQQATQASSADVLAVGGCRGEDGAPAGNAQVEGCRGYSSARRAEPTADAARQGHGSLSATLPTDCRVPGSLKSPAPAREAEVLPPTKKQKLETVKEDLKELKILYADGLITDEVYKLQQEAVLKLLRSA